MSVALRTATRIQDMDDVNVTPAVGVDEYVLTYDHDTAKFVLRAPAAAPDLSGYALLAGRAGGQTLYGGTTANDDITIHGTSNGTRTTSYVLLQPTAGNVGIGTSAPDVRLAVQSVSASSSVFAVKNSFNSNNMFVVGETAASDCSFSVNNSAGTPAAVIAGSIFSPSYIISAGMGIGIAVPLAELHIHKMTGSNYPIIRMSDDTGKYDFGIRSAWPGDTGQRGDLGYFQGNDTFIPIMSLRGGSKRVGINTLVPDTILHAALSNATTDAVDAIVTIDHVSTGTAAAGLGGGLKFNLQSSTTASQNAAAVEASWIVATHASRTARLALKAYDSAGAREGLRIDSSGSAALLGFYGHAAALQPAAYTPSNVTPDRAFDADTVLVAELADIVGTLIADLQSLGLVA